MPEQVQDFYPTPSTKSTCMYYTGIHPDTMQPVYVARTPHEKRLQRALMQCRKKSNYDLVREALQTAGREDLIGFGPECLIKPTKEEAIAAKRDRTSRPSAQATERRGDSRASDGARGRRTDKRADKSRVAPPRRRG